MSAVKKFMFDRSFDDELEGARPAAEEPEVVEDEPEPEPEAPTFSEEDVARARADGFAEGHARGVGEAAEATERRAADAIERVADSVAALLADREAVAEEAMRQAMEVGTAVAAKMFPELHRRGALDEVERIVALAVERMADEPKLTVRVAEAVRDTVAERIGRLAETRGFAGRVDVVADAALAEGDCAVEWANGGARRDAARMEREISEIVARNLGSAEPDSAAPADAAGHEPETEPETDPETQTAEEASPDAPPADTGGRDG